MDLSIRIDGSELVLGDGDDLDHAAIYLLGGRLIVTSAEKAPFDGRYVGLLAGAKGVLTMGEAKEQL